MFEDSPDRLAGRAGACAFVLALSALLVSAGSAGESFKGSGRAPTKISLIAPPIAPPVVPGGMATVPALPAALPAAASSVRPDTAGALTRIGAELGNGPAADQQSVLDAAWDKSAGAGQLRDNLSSRQQAAPSSAAGRLARAPIRDLLAHGVAAGSARMAEGELLFWEPKQKEADPYLTIPGDSEAVVQAKARNEIEGLRRVWFDLQATLKDKIPAAVLARVDGLVEQAKREIGREKLKAEVIVERLAAARSSGDEDSRAAAEIAAQDLVAALRNRQSLLYLSDDVSNLDLAAFHEDLKRLEKDRVMTKIFDRFLRLLYGFDAVDAKNGAIERTNAEGQRQILGGFFPLILREVDAGKTGEQALDAALKALQPNLDHWKAQLLKKPKDDYLKKKFALFEGFGAFFKAVKSELPSYDYVYERSDLPELARSKKEAEYRRHEQARAEMLASAPEEPQESVRQILHEFQAQAHSAILEEGRPLDYAAAQFFYRHSARIEELNLEMKKQGHEGPLDFLMRYGHVSRGGAGKKSEGRDLVVVTSEIRDEADYQELQTAFRGHGRVAAIMTLGTPDRDGATRIPHWVIFANANDIVTLPWAALDADGISLSELKRRLEESGGAPATALINGERGQAVINPSAKTRAEWLERARNSQKLADYTLARALLPAAFAGVSVRLLADEADPKAFEAVSGDSPLEASGAAGVGLLRMEQLMGALGMEWDGARLAAELGAMLERPLFLGGAPLIARLFDFESDKVPKFLSESTSRSEVSKLLRTHSNVRFYLDKTQPRFREFGKMQLKALFEAHRLRPKGNIRVLFSNVQTAEEIRGIEELIDEAGAEYAQERQDPASAARVVASLPIGYMVEDVATVANLKPFLDQISELRRGRPATERFLAFGTNDYQKSLLRGDPQAIEKVSKLDPREVRGIWAVAAAAAAQGMELTIDGKWGGSQRMLLALLTLRSFHGVNATPVVDRKQAPGLYELIRSATLEDLRQPSGSRPGSDLKTLVARLDSDEPPSLAEFDAACAAVAEKIKDRILTRISETGPGQ